MESNIPVFRIKHVGINTDSPVDASAMVDTLCGIFSLPRGNENESHIFVGDLFEIMKQQHPGAAGHIALQTEDVEAAMAYLSGKGITFREDTIRRNAEGKIIFVYFQQEFGGLAVHLTA